MSTNRKPLSAPEPQERKWYWAIHYPKAGFAHILYETQEDAIQAMLKGEQWRKDNKFAPLKFQIQRLYLKRFHPNGYGDSIPKGLCQRLTEARFEGFEIEGQCGLDAGHKGQCKIQD